ncbi:MAG: hypothetical protein M1480_19400 [Bacteroidetes bacterium]|nr:hypothetical protein [Bacteroidota bacterium]
MIKKIFLLVVLIVLFVGKNIFSQHEDQMKETESKVPELEQFHEVIYSIWHTAYPEKDYAALRSYAGEVNSLAEKIYSARLPGILRDKKAKWEKGIDEFKKSVNGYDSKAAGKDDAALLKAAEVLHSKYEMLVRVIRPVSKEVDEFHQQLYVIYHTYLPNKDYKKILSVSGKLVEKAEAISKMKISQKLEAKAEKINSAATDLLKATKDLDSLKKTTKGKDINLAVEKVHSKYQSLEELF